MHQTRREGWFVLIVATPPGIAPEEVRKAWIGIVLPVLGRETADLIAARKAEGFLSDNAGYVVTGPKALEALERHNKEAWEWWVIHFPRLLTEGVLAFEQTVCQEVPSDVASC
jgi:hypothetical protein